MNLNTKRLKAICDWYAAFDVSEINQSKTNCCFGGHLANLLLHYNKHYMSGAKAFAKAVGANLAHVYVMFRSIGIRDPFGLFSWEIPHDEAMRRLSLIEELPSLVGADVQMAYLRSADFRKADLSGIDLFGADLRRANLTEANLTGANLFEADLRGANLTDANLTDANLQGAILTGANLYGASLEGAKLPE